MTIAELRAECVRLAPDFTAEWRGDIFDARCTVGGRPFQLAMVRNVNGDIARVVLEVCLADLRGARA